MSATSESHKFQAEVQELLGLMIHSLYSHKEIFLRELISNASDALDKRRFLTLTQPELTADGERAAIRLAVDADERRLTISDSGVGMTREELVTHLGTIARSGTRKFLEAARDKKDAGLPQLIGQFGVGFYSSFMVAEEVVVETRRAGEEEATRWVSRGDGDYTLESCQRDAPGTTIELTLRARADDEEDFQDFTDPQLLRALVRRYSDFVEYPIELEKRFLESAQGLDEEKLPDGTEVWILNSRKPLWDRPKEEISDSEYKEFYKHLSHDWNDPLEWIHFRAEGTSTYTALLYLPSERPPEFLEGARDKSQISLYVRRVFVMGECEELLPPWLRFVRGVVDSQDLPLNVSREILQANRQIAAIRKRLVKKVLDACKAMLGDRREDYERLWNAFGQTFKEGIVIDPDSSESIAEVALFVSSALHGSDDGEELVTLDEYVGRMPEGQQEIYYLCSTSREGAQFSPHLEALRAQGAEVLFFIDPVDEWMLQRLNEYKGTPLKSVDRGDAPQESEERKGLREEKDRECRELLEAIERKLPERVGAVRFSSRLTESPAVLVDDEHAMGKHMERMLQQQGREVPPRKRTLELNPDHPVIERLTQVHRETPTSPTVEEFAELLYGQALLAEGSPLPDPLLFGRLVAKMMVAADPGEG